MGETRVKHIGKESPLGLSLKEDIVKVFKPASLPSYLRHGIFDYDVMTIKRIYQAELDLVKLRDFSPLAGKYLLISKKYKEMHPVHAHEGNLDFSSSRPLYTSTKFLSPLTIKFLVLLCP